MFQAAREKRTASVVFGIYFLLLVWLVLFKFATSLAEIPSIRSINLIPFYYDRETTTHLKEILYNILVFVPLGVYVQIFRGKWKGAAKCITVLGISFLFEAVQYVFAIGASDITDIIGNTLGGSIGIVLCAVMGKILPRKYIAMINAFGIFAEAVAIGMLALLLAANR